MKGKMSVGTASGGHAAHRIAVTLLVLLALVASIVVLRLAWFFMLRD